MNFMVSVFLQTLTLFIAAVLPVVAELTTPSATVPAIVAATIAGVSHLLNHYW